MTNWMYYPKSNKIPFHLNDVVKVFQKNENEIESPNNLLKSNEVLNVLRPDLEQIGYNVEKGKKSDEKIKVPVLYGINGSMEKSFEADAIHINNKSVLEIEAGRGVTNYQFLKDLFQACLMDNVDYLVIAVRNSYRNSNNFSTVISFFNAMYASGRLTLPLKGILIIGY